VASLEERIQSMIAPIVESEGAFLVDISLRKERGKKLVQVFVDTDSGIQIETCARISRELSREFDAQMLFEGEYLLEVSSPGLERPLKLLRQYPKNIGRQFHVRYRSTDAVETLRALLKAVDGERIVFEDEKGDKYDIGFSDIIESKEELPW
jgi:ribosome maturation factor RimP